MRSFKRFVKGQQICSIFILDCTIKNPQVIYWLLRMLVHMLRRLQILTDSNSKLLLFNKYFNFAITHVIIIKPICSSEVHNCTLPNMEQHLANPQTNFNDGVNISL